MPSIPISLPEHRIQLPLQTLGDAPTTLFPDDTESARRREEAQRVFDQGGKFSDNDLSAIVARLLLEQT